MNIATLLAQAAARHPDAAAVARGAVTVLRYRELARNAVAIAGALQQCLDPGARVLVAMRNRPEYLEALFGIWHAGLVAVPVNVRLHRDEIAYIAARADARVCIADTAVAEQLQETAAVRQGLRLVVAGGRDYAALLQHEPIAVTAAAADSPAWLFFTSGTTGRPKGATLTHRNLMVMALVHLADIDQIGPGDTMLHAAPLSHGCGLWAIPNTARAGLNVVLEGPSYDPAEVLALLRTHRNVSMYHAPTMLTRLVNHPGVQEADFANLRTLIYGGSHMYRPDLERALTLIGPKLVQIYGQGEAPNTISLLSKAQHVADGGAALEARLGSAGYARTGVEIRIADGDDRPLPAGELGEVLVRGDIVMAGYWQDAEATAATLRGGWLHTGDLGTLAEDGLLTLKDRSKDMIISGGSNIYPKEVEEVLLRHPAVLEVSVVGRPHREWGEEVCAFVVQRAGATVDAAALDALCLAHLARYKRPRLYRFVESLPKNAYNKVLKSELRAQLAAEAADGTGRR